MIYTSYFGKLKTLPTDIIPIAICAKVPTWYTGLHTKILAPSYYCLMDYKNNPDWNKYIERYQRETLSKLDAEEVANMLYTLADSEDIVLLCYEKTGDNCHRNLVADWFIEKDIPCIEWSEQLLELEENIEL